MSFSNVGNQTQAATTSASTSTTTAASVDTSLKMVNGEKLYKLREDLLKQLSTSPSPELKSQFQKIDTELKCREALVTSALYQWIVSQPGTALS